MPTPPSPRWERRGPSRECWAPTSSCSPARRSSCCCRSSSFLSSSGCPRSPTSSSGSSARCWAERSPACRIRRWEVSRSGRTWGVSPPASCFTGCSSCRSGSAPGASSETSTASKGHGRAGLEPGRSAGRSGMDLGQIVWLFFVLSALQPVLKQRLLENSRQRLLARLERQRNSRVILLVHRQETMSLLGFPLMRYNDINDSEDVIRACVMTDPDVPVDLVLHTPGGLVLAATQIARAIHARKGKVTVFVPHYAMSGGTLIALAADEIVMSPHAVLGPVDPQLGQFPAASLLKVVSRKPMAEIDDQTLILADVAEKALIQLRASAKEIMLRSQAPEKAEQLAGLLATGTWTHDYPITCDEARRLGLKVRTDMPHEFLELMALYPQPLRRQPSVEYLPVPRHAELSEPAERSQKG